MIDILLGDCRERLAELSAGRMQTAVTSPPYWQLRSYLPADDPRRALEIGHEPTISAYVTALVEVFEGVRRVLRPDGTLWVNLGDKRINDAKWGGGHTGAQKNQRSRTGGQPRDKIATGLPAKSWAGIPWRFALAMIDAGWALRDEIIWYKPNAQPEPVDDRTARTHEQVFLFSPSEDYYFDVDAILEPVSPNTNSRGKARPPKSQSADRSEVRNNPSWCASTAGRMAQRNPRSVWSIPTQRLSIPHYAAFPEALARRCILAGSAPSACAACGAAYRRQVERREIAGEIHRITTGWAPGCGCGTTETRRCAVLDPFVGTGTVLRVAEAEGRDATGIELYAEGYEPLIEQRLDGVQRAMQLEGL